ncbi:unnamed protein product [Diatraea saccharalis]|uniref:Thymidylate kinase n=1 Tax=Diatraea saccharalis TaxID=40085 RepID=A0A9N9W9H4_9NEOP|nr:unnamed protein product [Diatraea saccharalis]
MKVPRGALIVIEGLDRTGKTTQCKRLVSNLIEAQVKTEYTNFPNRNTEVGAVICNYLNSKNSLTNEAIHLLFSANRWEKAEEIIKTLQEGVTLIVDRYCYSGVAYSAAKGLDIDWCKSPDVGLPKPDKVFFFTMPLDQIEERKGYGNEKYEVSDFQKKVGEMFMKLKDDSWEILDANRSVDDIEKELLQRILQVLKEIEKKPLGKVWL